MPFYASLTRESVQVQQRAAAGLLALQAQLKASVPARTMAETLLLATWNIREFDSAKYGPRCAESFFYIAEIIDHFDLVAIQEVREDLTALHQLLDILGAWWRYIVTDVTAGAAGNGERLAFVYDSRKVTFNGLAGEVVLPDMPQKRVLQLARTPFLCGFRAGWSAFNLCTVHIYYGTEKPNEPRRVQEIQDLAQFLAARAKRAAAVPDARPEHLLLLGDFNIFGHNDATMQALTNAGFTIPSAIQPLSGSSLDKSHYYDQIAFIPQPGRFGTTGQAGVFDYYQSVFPRDAHATYADVLPEAYKTSANPRRYYNDWRTHQMSDHLLLWVELQIDFSQEYLQGLITPATATPAARRRSRRASQPPA